MEKKTKLTISGNPKKTFKKLDSQKTQGKKTVIIEKQSLKPRYLNCLKWNTIDLWWIGLQVACFCV